MFFSFYLQDTETPFTLGRFIIDREYFMSESFRHFSTAISFSESDSFNGRISKVSILFVNIFCTGIFHALLKLCWIEDLSEANSVALSNFGNIILSQLLILQISSKHFVNIQLYAWLPRSEETSHKVFSKRKITTCTLTYWNRFFANVETLRWGNYSLRSWLNWFIIRLSKGNAKQVTRTLFTADATIDSVDVTIKSNPCLIPIWSTEISFQQE